jgi:hypothetical protein
MDQQDTTTINNKNILVCSCHYQRECRQEEHCKQQGSCDHVSLYQQECHKGECNQKEHHEQHHHNQQYCKQQQQSMQHAPNNNLCDHVIKQDCHWTAEEEKAITEIYQEELIVFY